MGLIGFTSRPCLCFGLGEFTRISPINTGAKLFETRLSAERARNSRRMLSRDSALFQPVFDVLTKNLPADSLSEASGTVFKGFDSLLDAGFLGHWSALHAK